MTAVPAEEAEGTFYLLVCRDCDDRERLLPLPFNSAAARGKWAAGHTAGTGHDRWTVWEEPR